MKIFVQFSFRRYPKRAYSADAMIGTIPPPRLLQSKVVLTAMVYTQDLEVYTVVRVPRLIARGTFIATC